MVDGATLDCKGFSIMGPVLDANTLSTGADNLPAGILLTNGGSLKNCDVSGFKTCVHVRTNGGGSTVSSVDNVFMSECRLGLFTIDDPVDVKNSATVDNFLGVRLGATTTGLVNPAKFDGLTACQNMLDFTAPGGNGENVDTGSKDIVCGTSSQSLCSSQFLDADEITDCGCPESSS